MSTAAQHVEGINWQLIHELLIAEMERMDKGTSKYTSHPQWWKNEFNRMNTIAAEKAEKQS